MCACDCKNAVSEGALLGHIFKNRCLQLGKITTEFIFVQAVCICSPNHHAPLTYHDHPNIPLRHSVFTLRLSEK